MAKKTDGADWLAKLSQLAKSSSKTDGFLSSAEIEERLGLNNDNVRKLLRAAKAAGKLQIRRVTIEGIDGIQHASVVYKVV